MVAHQTGRSRAAKATQRNPILQNQKNKQNKTQKTNKQKTPKTKKPKSKKPYVLDSWWTQFSNYAETEWTVDRRTRVGLHFSYFGFSVSASTDLCFSKDWLCLVSKRWELCLVILVTLNLLCLWLLSRQLHQKQWTSFGHKTGCFLIALNYSFIHERRKEHV